MLTRKTPLTLATSLTIEGQGESFSFQIEYKNITNADMDAFNNTPSVVNKPEKEGDEHPRRSLAETILHIVNGWESEYPLTLEGIQEMEQDRPGMCMSILGGWYKARGVHIVGN